MSYAHRFLLAATLLLVGCAADTPEAPPETAAPAAAPSAFSSPVIQVGVVVEDLDRALAFYEDVIGMQRTGGFSIDEDFGQRSGLTGGTPFEVVVLGLADSPAATQWKLMSFGQAAAHPRPTHIQDDTGMQYITINVNDLTPFVERITAAGIPFLGDTPTPLSGGRHFVLVQDPDGTFVELIGPMGTATE